MESNGAVWEGRAVAPVVREAVALLKRAGLTEQEALDHLLESGAQAVLGPLRRILGNGATPGVSAFPASAWEADGELLLETGEGGESKEGGQTFLVALLESRGLTVVGQVEPDPKDKYLDAVALEIGRNLASFLPVLRRVKASLSKDGRSYHRFAKVPPETVSTCVSLARKMHRYGLFDDFRYDPGQKEMHVRVPKVGAIHNFFSGDWMERYLRAVAEGFLPPGGVAVRGLKVRFPWGGEGEMDLLVASPEGLHLWVEAKTGLYADRIPRYQEIRKLLGLSRERAVLAVLEEDREAVEAQSLLLDYRIVHLSEVEGILREIFPQG